MAGRVVKIGDAMTLRDFDRHIVDGAVERVALSTTSSRRAFLAGEEVNVVGGVPGAEIE